MSRRIVIAVMSLALCLAVAAPALASRLDPKTEKEVKELMQKMAKAYMAGDVSSLMSIHSGDPILAVGTGSHEWLDSRNKLEANYKRDITQALDLKLDCQLKSINRQGDVVWIAALMPVTAKTAQSMASFTARFTAVLIKQRGKWVVVQSHTSLPAAGQAEGRSYPSSK